MTGAGVDGVGDTDGVVCAGVDDSSLVCCGGAVEIFSDSKNLTSDSDDESEDSVEVDVVVVVVVVVVVDVVVDSVVVVETISMGM